MTRTLSVGEVLIGLDQAITATFPAPIWVRGEVSGFRRTNRGAAFFTLVDGELPDRSIDVAARGRIIHDVDQALNAANVGSLREGIEVRLLATVGQQAGRIRLSLLKVDPEFIAGRLALDRDETLRRLKADGSLERNSQIAVPLLPLNIGLITSVGSAAHADFRDGIKRSGYRFKVSLVEARMQGEGAHETVERALLRISQEQLDVVVVARGGGSKLDLATFDSETVARAIAAMPVPVITAIGHETDQTVADAVAAIPVKTPSAAAEWLVTRVADFAGKVETASRVIAEGARQAMARAHSQFDQSARGVAGVRATLDRQLDRLQLLSDDVASQAREVLAKQELILDSLGQIVATVGLEPTLRRGFAVVMRPDGGAVKHAASLRTGDPVRVRMADGAVGMRVEEEAS